MNEDPQTYEGGFVQVKTTGRHNVYKGTIRHRETHQIIWKCNHIHSRPEYNSRSQDGPGIWEYSALNCGRVAYRQDARDQTPEGAFGLVGSSYLGEEAREDTKFVSVGEMEFVGQVWLTENGDRILKVWMREGPAVKGTVFMDQPKRTVLPDAVSTAVLNTWVTAAWLLKGSVWGLTFQDHYVPVRVTGNQEEALREILGPLGLYDAPKRAPIKTKEEPEPQSKVKPRLRIARDEDDRRVFEVLNEFEEVIKTSPHRGVAAQALKELTG